MSHVRSFTYGLLSVSFVGMCTFLSWAWGNRCLTAVGLDAIAYGGAALVVASLDVLMLWRIGEGMAGLDRQAGL